MLSIKKQYVVNESNEPVGVILDLETFEKIESILEDFLLSQRIEETSDETPLSLDEARKYYAKLKKGR